MPATKDPPTPLSAVPLPRWPRMTANSGSAVAPLRVVVADDDVLLREGLASLLTRADCEVVGQASDGEELLAVVREKRPELVIVDIRMPPTYSTEGLDAARFIRKERPDTALLVLSAHVETGHAMDMLANGRKVGYLLKSRIVDLAGFFDSLERIANGASVVDPALVQHLVAARRRGDRLNVLTAREQDVLALMAEGRSNAGIAARLVLSEFTVEKHVHHIFLKLDLPEDAQDHRRVRAVIAYLKPDDDIPAAH